MSSPTHASPPHSYPLRSAMKHSSAATSPVSSPPVRSQTLPGTPDMESLPLSTTSTSTSTSSCHHGDSLQKTSSQLSFGSQSPSPYFAMLPRTPVPGYQPKVSFDTFENSAANMFSFTLSSKSDGYKRTRNTRIFLCATSPDESGSGALDWALESFVQDGDEFVVFRGIEEDDLEKDHDSIRDDARELMKYVQEKSQEVDPDRKLSIILEYIAGKVTDTLDRLIVLYRPDSVIVGTRGRKIWQMGLKGTMGSVSRYCLTHSPVPIIVVRPERKTKKAIEKRRADPKRGFHFG
ncbi:hypothetical protein E1B28_006778 [Marasmius oreades]|uniref:UspA domain-containing protein n=1 Tax=Marasmius oreades TaxID=181124 RepID=A0A9P8AAN8_9AGAR|nr:uncharacterized protein E1B28_006778 [Marasmius oreades]KAG7096102.1 hypothetical protein E1B28_006778 [Marasmius oreades]